jgi:hypothetical protein
MSQSITTLGYRYNTEQEAKDAVRAINIFHGIPVSADATTQTWCDYGYNNEYWYIVWDNTLNLILGEPTEITIIMN